MMKTIWTWTRLSAQGTTSYWMNNYPTFAGTISNLVKLFLKLRGTPVVFIQLSFNAGDGLLLISPAQSEIPRVPVSRTVVRSVGLIYLILSVLRTSEIYIFGFKTLIILQLRLKLQIFIVCTSMSHIEGVKC